MKIQIVCSFCGTTSVTRDAVVRWNADSQEWEASSVFDNADCDICGGETRLDEVPYQQWSEQLRMEHQLYDYTYWMAEEDMRNVAYVADTDGSILWSDTCDQFGHDLQDAEEALDAARTEIINRKYS